MGLIAVIVLTLALIGNPAAADETRSTVEFGPDLAVNTGDMTLSKTVLLSGVEFNISIKVYNLGDEDAIVVTVDLLVDTESIDRITLDAIPVDGWLSVGFDLGLPEGDHELAILVDSDDTIDERREDNNDAVMPVHVRGLPDATVESEDLDVSNAHPMEGDVINIDAIVHNSGESDATLVVVQFWDGYPGEGFLVANRTTSIIAGGQQLVSTPWDTSGLGGTHEIFVNISRVLPGEESLDNNLASLTVLVFTEWDLVVDDLTGDVTIDQEWTQDGFVTVRDGATLTISGILFSFLQNYPNQFALFVENGGSLVLDNAIVESDQSLLVLLNDGTSLTMTGDSLLVANVTMEGDVDVEIVESQVVGGLLGSATSVVITDATVEGPVELSTLWFEVTRSTLLVNSPVVLSATSSVMVDSLVLGPSQTSLYLLLGSSVELRNVTCADVIAEDTSVAMVFRRVEVLVVDESNLVIPGANIEIRHYINGTVITTAVGGDDGKATVEILSDVIEGGEPHFIGNYLIYANFFSEEASEPLLLTPFPAMDLGSNNPEATVVLPPIEPRNLLEATAGDMHVEVGKTMDLVANFVQDGNIIVEGTLTVSDAVLTVLQDRDQQFYVVVEGNGKLILQGGELISTHNVNVYLYDNASIEIWPGSVLDVNALVAKDGSSVKANASLIDARLLLRGGQVEIIGGCQVVADKVVIEASMLTIDGGSIQAENVQVDASSVSMDDLDLTAMDVDVVSGRVDLTGCKITVDTLSIEATTVYVTESEILAQEPLDLSVATFYMDTSSSNVLLGTERYAGKIYLTDAIVPWPFSQGNATVLVYWYLSLTVQDVLGNPVSSATIDIDFTNNETVVASGVTNDNGNARFPLLGSIIGPEGEYFLGNYRITVYSPKEGDQTTVVRYINLNQAKSSFANFLTPMVPPTMIGVDISVVNTTIEAGTSFTLNGVATAIYPTVRSALTSGDVTVRLWNNDTTWTNETTMSAAGTFIFTVPAPAREGIYYIQVIVDPTGDYADVADGTSNMLTLDIFPPGPHVLVVVLNPDRIDPFYAGDPLLIQGTVRYNNNQGAPAANAKVFIKDPITKQTYQTVADGLGAFEYSLTGPSFYGVYDYVVTAQDEESGVETESGAKLVVVTEEAKDTDEGGKSNLLLIIVIAIVAVAGSVGGLMIYWITSSKGRMVECGECGTLVRENAVSCPKCGIEFESEVAKCSVCESWIKSDADSCPYCNTPFRSLEGVEEEGAQAVGPGPEGGEPEGETATEEGEEPPGGELVVDLDETEVSVPPEAIKKVPEGLKREIRPKPVVQRKAVKEVRRELDSEDIHNGNGDPAQRPRVKKVASQPAPPRDDDHEGDDSETSLHGGPDVVDDPDWGDDDLEEDKEVV